MIISRYLIKEVCSTVAAATAILLMIFLCTQFIHYLTAAAGGKYTTILLFQIMLLQVPYLLGLLLPLGFFLAILLAYGRLYLDREMSVLFSCGMSPAKLFGLTFAMASFVAVIVGVLSLWLSPYVASEQKRLFAQAQATPLIETISPGRFFSMNDGKSVFYVEGVTRDRQDFQHIFFAELTSPPQNEVENEQSNEKMWSITTAEKGHQVVDKKNDDAYFQVNNGVRYTGAPGMKDFQKEQFGQLTLKFSSAIPLVSHHKEALSTLKLWKRSDKDLANIAELQWRFALPISVLLLGLLALPLSKINPRQGKYSQLVPAILIYILYANMMFVGRDWLESGTVPTVLGLWWLHGVFLLLALGIIFWQSSLRGQFIRSLHARVSIQ